MAKEDSFNWFACSLVLMLISSVCSAGVIVSGSTYDAYDAAFEDVDVLDSAGKIVWGSGFASGTYLGKGWVLTAAHVAELPIDLSFTINGATYASSAVHINDGWSGVFAEGGDIALLRLDESNVPAQTVLLYSGSTAGLLDEVFYLSGYGKTGTGDTGATGLGGVLHAGENLIEETGGSAAFFAGYDEAILCFDFDDPSAGNDGYFWSDNQALTYEYMIAQGDSGGGGFVFLDGQYVLGGVNSFVLALDGDMDSSYSDIGALTSVGEFTDWVFEVTGTDFTGLLAPGDANGDGKMDSADLAIWQQNYDPLGDNDNTFAMGDWADNGLIDSADLALWQHNFDPIGGSAMVGHAPEPGAFFVMTAAGLPLLLKRKRKSRTCFGAEA